MNINKINNNLQVYKKLEVNKVRPEKVKLAKDEIEFSEGAMDYKLAMEKVKEVPDMRMDKVEKLKKEVQSGNYNVSGREIVDKIYDNLNFNKRL